MHPESRRGPGALYAERLVTRAEVKRHVVVVGGGPAGLKAAEIAARRGHQVTLLERSDHLGGQVRLAARQPLHEEVVEVTHYLESTVRRLGVEIWTNATADVDGLLELEPDVIIVATGSQPDLPPGRRGTPEDPDAGTIARSRGLQVPNALPGLDGPLVRSSDEVLEGPDPTGKRVVVIDAHGHWEAAGTAEYLADRGATVELVTTRPEPGFGLEATNRAMFLQRARTKGIRMTPHTEVRSIDADGVTVLDILNGTERRIAPLDWSFPCGPGRRGTTCSSSSSIGSSPSRGAAPQVLRIGDASAPRLHPDDHPRGPPASDGAVMTPDPVCVKVVPRSAVPLRLDPATGRLDRTGPSEVNPPDTLRDRGGHARAGARRGRRGARGDDPRRGRRKSPSRTGDGGRPRDRGQRPSDRGSDLLGTSRCPGGRSSRRRPSTWSSSAPCPWMGPAACWRPRSRHGSAAGRIGIDGIVIEDDAAAEQLVRSTAVSRSSKPRCRRSSRSPARRIPRDTPRSARSSPRRRS